MNDKLIDIHLDGIVYAEIPLGGIARMWTNIINRLPDHGCRVFLYLPHENLQIPSFREDVQFIRYPRHYRLRPGRMFNPLTERYQQHALDAMWSRARSGVFQSTHFTTNTNLIIPQVVTVHDLFHERLPHCFSEAEKHPFCERRKECVDAADAVICVSRKTASDVDSTYNLSNVKNFVVWQAVESIFQPLSNSDSRPETHLNQDKPYILYIGTRYPYKNFSGLLAGFAAWRDNEQYNLLAIGKPPVPGELALMHALGISERVKFIPALPDPDLALAYGMASAVVMPSLSEGFGLPLWEAMACEVPVVASRGGALPEIGGDIPVYFDFGTPDNIARALDEAIAIERPSDRLDAGRQRATSRTWDDVTAEYVDVYRSLLK